MYDADESKTADAHCMPVCLLPLLVVRQEATARMISVGSHSGDTPASCPFQLGIANQRQASALLCLLASFIVQLTPAQPESAKLVSNATGRHSTDAIHSYSFSLSTNLHSAALILAYLELCSANVPTLESQSVTVLYLLLLLLLLKLEVGSTRCSWHESIGRQTLATG